MIVFDKNKKPFMPLTQFYHHQIKRVSETSALTYLTVLERFFHWLENKSNYQKRRVKWSDEPDMIRAATEEYLQTQMNCKVRSKSNYQLVHVTSKSPQTINQFLCAIKSFYRTMIYLKLYSSSNPYINQNYSLRIAHGFRENKPRLPQLAGTEIPIQSYRKDTNSYFKLINEKWSPSIIDDIHLPYLIYQAGARAGWKLRDEVIIRLLFETGARVSEILGLTIGDYRKRVGKYEMATFNKGSEKKRTKFIRFTPDTLKLLIRYVNGDRKKHCRTILKFNTLPDEAPIFVNVNGDQYKYHAFYLQWNNILNYGGLKLNPHKTRHWFVTNMIRSTYEVSDNESEIIRKKKELVQYMKWRSEDTLLVYEHFFNENNVRDLQDRLFIKMEEYKEKSHFNSTIDKKISSAVKHNETLQSFDEEWIGLSTLNQ
ncbi:tyrosine-type recombinase/integrase, partial [Paenibacillus alvei]